MEDRRVGGAWLCEAGGDRRIVDDARTNVKQSPRVPLGGEATILVESLILAQDQRWRRA